MSLPRRNPWKTRRQANRTASRETRGLHHHVYVVLLHPRVAAFKTVLKANPDRDPGKPCVYVGMTGLDPVERFENHRKGHKASGFVRNHGVQLLPELYECFNPMPFDVAVKMEEELAGDLRAQGYTVTGGK